jgi:hypothetical protein
MVKKKNDLNKLTNDLYASIYIFSNLIRVFQKDEAYVCYHENAAKGFLREKPAEKIINITKLFINYKKSFEMDYLSSSLNRVNGKLSDLAEFYKNTQHLTYTDQIKEEEKHFTKLHIYLSLKQSQKILKRNLKDYLFEEKVSNH